MVIKLPSIAALKGHVQIPNTLLAGYFRKIRADNLIFRFDRSNYALEDGVLWHYLTTCQKIKNPANAYLQGY